MGTKGDFFRISPFIALQVFLLFVVVQACGGKQTLSDDAIRATDSIVKANEENVDALRSLIADFAAKDNVYGEVICYKALGRLFREQSNFIESINIHKKGLDKAIALKDTIQIIQALNNIATNYRRMGILDEAAVYHYRALEYCNAYSDKTGDVSRKNRVVSLNGVGNIYMTMENYDKADSVLRQALAGEKALGSALGQAINYANLGAIFESKEMTDSAQRYYELSMHYNKEANSDLGIALCHSHFGRLHEKRGNLDSAIAEYKSAYDIMSNSKDMWHWLEACLALARAYIDKNDLTTASQYLSKATESAREIHSLEHLAEAYRLRYLISNQQGDLKGALDSYILSQKYNDSISSEKNLVQMQNARINYERELKKTEISQIQQAYQNERSLRRTILIGSIVFVIIAILVIILLINVIRLRNQKSRIIRRTDQMRASFFTNITHEFRTPLTVIQAAARELADNSEEDSMTYNNAVDILRNESRLLNLINQILDMAKMDATDTTPLQWRHGDVVEFVNILCDGLRHYGADRNVSVICVSLKEKIEADFIPDYMQKIVCNLVSNAIKFSKPDSSVYLLLRTMGSDLQIVVCDFGIGISDEAMQNIFTPFYQVEGVNANIGSGVGLSVVKLAVEKMNGSIDVHSALDEGAMFVVTIPLACNDTSADPLNISEYFKSYLHKHGSAPTLPNQKSEDEILADEDATCVLIVEDTPEVAHYMMRQLNRDYKYQFATNGKEGLELAMKLVPDIIITDIMMPVMDGFELCKQIRESELLSHVPIIMVTAKATHEDRIKGLSLGADAYIEKPFHADELNVRVEKLLEQRKMLQMKYISSEPEENINDEEMPSITANDKMFLTKVTDAVTEQITNGRVDYALLASTLCLSRAQLNRKLKAITGETTTEYILKIKISLAKHLLDSTDKSIFEIAMDCGMDSDSYFCTLFKKSTGVTPLQYRNRVKQEA